MGRGFAEILFGELQGSPQRYAIQYRALHSFDASLGMRPGAPGISAESTGALVAGANQIVYGDFSVVNGALHATATEEDLATHKMAPVASASGPASDGIFPVAERWRGSWAGRHPFGTRNPQAVRDYVAALEAIRLRIPGFRPGGRGRPRFRTRLRFLVGCGDQPERNRAEADRIVEQAPPHRVLLRARPGATGSWRSGSGAAIFMPNWRRAANWPGWTRRIPITIAHWQRR
jgi:hypothetical protein